MKLGATDYALIRLARSGWPVLKSLGNLETHLLRSKLEGIAITRPVFIAGLARSGTTILLQEMANTELFATHQYRDFPFLTIPFVWNRFLDRQATKSAAVERPHQDRITITAESPEAFEEPLWQQFFPDLHCPRRIHLLDATTHHEEFEQFFRDHVRKVMLIRGRPRYLSKGNYNVTRIEYLSKLFPDARFVIPIRHPLDQVASLVRQHQLFTRYAAQDKRVPRYLAAAGHYEFGPQREPIRLSHSESKRIVASWKRGDDHTGYAIQWAAVYQFVHQLKEQHEHVAEKILIVRHEDLCAHPLGQLRAILEHAQADFHGSLASRLESGIASSTPHSVNLDSRTRDRIWAETEVVATSFGYDSDSKAPGKTPATDNDKTATLFSGGRSVV